MYTRPIHAPTVAVLIPCYNEERHIEACLRSLLSDPYPQERLEILVLDGMSEDATPQIVDKIAEEHPCVRRIENPDRQKPHALNLGIRQTSSDVVMRIGAHANYPQDYITDIVRSMQKNNADNIGGLQRTIVEGDWLEQAVALMVSHPFAIGNAMHRLETDSTEAREAESVFPGCYRREILDRVGPFNEYLIRTQDREFDRRIKQAGGRIVLDPTIECFYYPRTNIGQYLRWNMEGAYWLFYARRFTNAPMLSWRNWVPKLFLDYHLLTILMLIFWTPVGLAMLAPLAIYAVLCLFFGLRATAKGRSIATGLAMAPLFWLTHISYGIGAKAGWTMALIRGKRVWTPAS